MYCRGTRKKRERLLEETEEKVGVVNPSLVRHTIGPDKEILFA